MSGQRNGFSQNACSTTNASGGQTTDPGSIGPRFLRGDVLAGRFEIVRFLACGGMGEVYEAQDRLLHNSPVALKTILPKRALEADSRLRLKKEVMLAREVNHPNVCPIYDLFECDQPEPTCFLTMKLLEGETLGQRLRGDRPISPEEALSIVRQLCSALEAAHSAGVVHRDLKPGNIMLQGSGATVKAIVTDFGIALAYEADRTVSIPGYVVGTPGYIAPEIYHGEPAMPASDLYALGVVLHELFTCRKPGSAPLENEDSGRRRTIPGWCAPLVSACLQRDPQVRKREFQRALERLNRHENVIGEPAHRQLTRRALLGVGAAAACAVTGGVVWREHLVEKVLHPLPRKRFVALIDFPSTPDQRTGALVHGVIGAIEAELSRMEAFDRDLFVMAAPQLSAPTEAALLQAVRESLGANLALAAQGSVTDDHLRLVFKVLDAATGAVLRAQEFAVPASNLQAAANRAVLAAANLLNVHLNRQSADEPNFATSSEQAYKYFQTAEDLMKQPNDAGLDKALENYKSAVEADPRYAIAYSKLALAYCRYYALHGDPGALDLANKNAELALRLNPKLVNGHIALSYVDDLQGNKQQAFAEIGKALALDPANARTLFWQAQIYRRMNRWSEAEQIYKRILEQRPNYWLAYNDLGYVLNAQGRYREALDAFRSETLANPHSALAFSNLGDLYFKLGDSEQAKQSYEKSLSLSPTEWACSGLGAALRSEGKYSEALRYQLRATELNPSNDVNWLDLGDCYESMHRAGDARATYLRARKQVETTLQVDSADAGAWMRLALYKIKTGQAAGALTVASKAGPADSLDLDSRVIQARIYEDLGKREDALAVLAQCFQKGLTRREIEYIPDFQALRKDPAFLGIVIKR